MALAASTLFGEIPPFATRKRTKFSVGAKEARGAVHFRALLHNSPLKTTFRGAFFRVSRVEVWNAPKQPSGTHGRRR
jgi:hypothetical protein